MPKEPNAFKPMKPPGAIRAPKIPSFGFNPLSAVAYLTFFCFLLPAQLLAQDLGLVRRGTWPPFSHGSHGPALAVAIQSGYAFVALDTGGLAIIDITSAANPHRVGGYDTSGQANAVAVSGNHAYVADHFDGLQVIDVSNPANPHRVGGYDTDGDAQGVAVSGNYAYVADAPRWDGTNYVGGGLVVIDITNPANPQRVGGYNTSGSAVGVAVSGNYAYVVINCGLFCGGFLDVIDISDPANPQRVGGYVTWASDVAVSGNYAYVADHNAGLQVIDVSNPANPQRVGGYDTSGSAWDVAVSGNYAYVADYDAGLQVIDVSAAANPQRVGTHGTGGLADHVAVSGNYAYVANVPTCTGNVGGLQVIDVGNPANPQPVGGYIISSPQGLAVSGNYAYLGNLGPIICPAGAGNHASPADDTAGLQVIDVSNPANPQRVGGYSGYALDVAVSGNYAYVAAGQRWIGSNYFGSFEVIDVSSPANPKRVGGYDIGGGYAVGVAVSGNYAYVADYNAGLQVIDVSSPANPQRVGAYSTFWEAQGVAVSGNYACVAAGTNGLEVIDVSNLANPQWVGGYDTSGYVADVAVSGHYAYVADGAAGLQVIDVSNPTQPRRVGGNSAFDAFDVTVAGNNVFVTAGEQGLMVLDLFRAPLRLEHLSPQQPGTFRFLLHGEAGLSVRVQRSSNLRDWEDWQSVTLGAAPTELSDAEVGTAVRRFYRAVTP